MIPPLLVGAGLVALAVGVAILRSFGGAYRIGRLLSATPEVPLTEALAIARGGRPRYVRLEGRIDAPEVFEDEAGRPLVLRTVRLEVRDGDGWRSVGGERRVLPFTLDAGLDSIGVDAESLAEGLVMIARESTGLVGEAPSAFPSEIDPSLPGRIRVEQVSAVDHAIACGVPRLEPDGRVVLGAGLGRPLVLTTLGRDDAVRVLAGGDRRRTLAASVALAAGLLLVTIGLVAALVGTLTPATALAADPTPAAASTGDTAAPDAGDTRSSGSGPGFVGAPLLAIGGVLGIGLATAGLTLLYVRLTGGPNQR